MRCRGRYREMLTRMAKESGIATPTADDLVRLDRARTGKMLSNADRESPIDPDARIAKLKDGRTRLAYKPEYALDLDTGAISAAELHEADHMRAAQRFFRSARSVVGFVPDRVTTDGYNSHPRAIRSTLGRSVRHRTSVYLNNRLEQDHRGIKGRIRCMRGFKEHDAADRFCREYD